MIEREFVGWDRPFLGLAVDWLLTQRDALPTMLVVVPTAQSGRRLREALAEKAGALLAPRVTVPGAFLRSRDEEAAPDWLERVAWVETLEAIDDWEPFRELFPESPAGEPGWAGGLAMEMVRLRHGLQENGLLLETAARKLEATVEGGRWAALAALEVAVERKLAEWQTVSRSRLLHEGIQIPAGVDQVVLAGVADMPPLVERALMAWQGKVTALIGAPASEAGEFSVLGRPLESWATRPLSWPNGTVEVVADPRQQAAEALRIIGEMGSSSDHVALGSADEEVATELARTFSRAGWPAFHPAAESLASGLGRWFGIWREWLTEPKLSVMADLLALPETGVLVAGRRAQKATQLAQLRDRWMITRPEDLRRRIAAGEFLSDRDREASEQVGKAVETLESWRNRFKTGDFVATMNDMLRALARNGPATSEAAEAVSSWLVDAREILRMVDRGAGFWIDILVSELPAPAPQPPEGRVIDVQGWLEIFHEPGLHLILCGINDGKVPGRAGGEPWLGEASRTLLGLPPEVTRAARDAYLFQALQEARRDGGRVDVFCGKSGAGGETLLPSRLLLAGTRDELPDRVRQLFKDVEPPEAGLRWHADWKWQPRAVPPRQRLSATSLGDYLACPFRYFLKHAARMQSPDTARGEWNARDFGNVAHTVLERWGSDTEAREFEKTEAIHAWVSAELDRVVAEWFGNRPPLAVRIQTETLRQRLLWFARAQAVNRVEGWQVQEIERRIEIPVHGSTVVARIDRIDRHRESGQLRVLDYKTGNVESVEKAHRTAIIATTKLPEHIPEDCPVIHQAMVRNKIGPSRWTNLQLPLYAVALVDSGADLPEPAYFSLGSTASGTGIVPWTDFSTADLEAARKCAEWIAKQVAAGVFWPPAERVTYDDYAVLTAGRPMAEMCSPVPPIEPAKPTGLVRETDH